MTKVIYAAHNRKARHGAPDPTKIKKRSQYRAEHAQEVLGDTHRPLGARGVDPKSVPTGYRLGGYTGKYEMYREVMAPGAVGAKLRHQKKSRTYVVITGMGSVFVEQEGVEEKKYARLLPGDEITIAPGETHQLFTTAKAHLEFLVCQEAKYEDKLETLEEARALEVPADLLNKSRSEEDPMELTEMPVRRKRNNRTAQILWEKKRAAAYRAGGERLAEFLANEGASPPTGTSEENVSDLVPAQQHGSPKGNASGGFQGINADPKAIINDMLEGSDYTEAELREAGLI